MPPVAESPSLLDRFVLRARELYTLPRVAVEILELTRDPQVDARLLTACVENDPALTSRILRVVNSSVFGLSRSVRDLNQAVALLGSTPLKMLVLGFSLPDALFHRSQSEYLAAYWRRTLIKAVSAREIAEHVWRMSGDEAFLAALLQEIGLLVLIQDLGAPFAEFAQRVEESEQDLLASEKAALGFDHVDLTARLLSTWQLPETLIAAAILPSSPERFERLPPTKRAVPQILHLADMLSQLLAEERHGLLHSLLEAGRRYHDLSPAKLDQLIERLESKVKDLSDVLELDFPAGRSYREVVAEAHAKLAELSLQAVGAMAAAEPAIVTLAEKRQLQDAVERALSSPWTRASKRTAEAASPVEQKPAATELVIADPLERLRDRNLWLKNEKLLTAVSRAAATCRADRIPVSVLLVVAPQRGSDAWPDSLFPRRIQEALREAEQPRAECVDLLHAGCAVLFCGSDRQQAVASARSLLAMHETIMGKAARRGSAFAIGLAAMNVVPPNFQPLDLVTAAQRCLSAALSAGGHGLKSIEL